jgi:hypothetical protein
MVCHIHAAGASFATPPQTDLSDIRVTLHRRLRKVLAWAESGVHTFLTGKYMPEGEVMDAPRIPPIDAELALAEVHLRREQVVDSNLVPVWFWSTIGVLMVLFVAAVESERPLIVAAGSIGYAAGLGTLVVAMVRRSRVQVRTELLGVRGGLAIAAFTLALVAAGLGLGFGLDALGVPWPATIACVPVAVALATGGPRLMAYLRRLMLARPAAGS